jgi:hypothetical protein
MPIVAQDCEVVASLEGMKVEIREGICSLSEYDFDQNKWHRIDSAQWPLSRDGAEHWLAGWNRVDRFAAMCSLTARNSE